jgi:Ca-activated chloride channel homolog
MLYNFLLQFEFNRLEVLWLLLVLPVLLLFTYKNKAAGFSVSDTAGYYEHKGRLIWAGLPKWLQLLSVAAIILALAQPRTFKKYTLNNTEGIDIVVCLDISGSMNAMDLKPNRLSAAKDMAAEFVRNRNNDRIGLVTFSAEAFTNCPITNHYDFLLNTIASLERGLLKDGTHIGEGLGTAVSGLEKSTAKSKVVILLTDGVNDPNEQDVSPESAKELAKNFKVKVYTIGVGTEGMAPTPDFDAAGNSTIVMRQVRIDEPLLQNIAKETGGKYYRAKDNDGLKKIYEEIDQLEKVKIDATSFVKYTEHFQPFIIVAIACLFISLLLSYTVLRVFP